MPRGISVHVGVNQSIAPEISAPKLEGCENDAIAMHKLARLGGFEGGPPLIGQAAKFEAVTTAIAEAAVVLEPGETFLFTFSGHGTRRGTDDFQEKDSKDETLVLHDLLLVDNVFRRLLWPEFKEGVLCIGLSDSCFSGGGFHNNAFGTGPEMHADVDLAVAGVGLHASSSFATTTTKKKTQFVGPRRYSSERGNGVQSKLIPQAKAAAHYNNEELEPFYRKLRQSLPVEPPDINASVLLIGACREFETALDGTPNSFFTKHLLDVIQQNSLLTYDELVAEILVRMGVGTLQHPTITRVGKPLPPSFVPKAAFTL